MTRPELICWVTKASVRIDTDRGGKLHQLDLGTLVLKLGIDEETDIQSLLGALDQISSALRKQQIERFGVTHEVVQS